MGTGRTDRQDEFWRTDWLVSERSQTSSDATGLDEVRRILQCARRSIMESMRSMRDRQCDDSERTSKDAHYVPCRSLKVHLRPVGCSEIRMDGHNICSPLLTSCPQ